MRRIPGADVGAGVSDSGDLPPRRPTQPDGVVDLHLGDHPRGRVHQPGDRGREGGCERRSIRLNIYLRLVYRNIRANLDRASLFFELIFPLFFIFVQGFGLNGIVPPFDVGNGRVISYSLFLAAGAGTLTVINRGTNAGAQLWFDRENGMFEQLLMGPLTPAQYILSIIFSTLIIRVAGSLLVFCFAVSVFGGNFSPPWEAAL